MIKLYSTCTPPAIFRAWCLLQTRINILLFVSELAIAHRISLPPCQFCSERGEMVMNRKEPRSLYSARAPEKRDLEKSTR